MSEVADAVVLGAGVVGCSIALELARAGLAVTVLDSRPGPGMGSTGASSAVVRFTYSTWEGVALSWESRHRWEAWADHLGHRDPDGLARFVRCGVALLDCVDAPREVMTPLFDRAGIPYEVWGPAELAARIPGIDTGRYHPPRPVGSPEFFDPATAALGALFTPDGGYVPDPQRAAANLAAAAAAHGATFRYRTTAGTIERAGRTWRVGTGTGELEAPVLVNAAGPWSSRVNRMAGVGDDFGVTLRPLRQEVHQLPGPVPPGLPAFADLDLGTYVRPEGPGLLVGGTEPACDPLEWLDDPDDADLRPTGERFEAQVLRAARRLPDLAVPRRPAGVVGVYDVSSDWRPVYDRTGADGFYVAVGTSGNQFKNAPVVGSLMAALILAVEGGHDHDRDPVRFSCTGTGHEVDLGAFSRLRVSDPAAATTVIG